MADVVQPAAMFAMSERHLQENKSLEAGRQLLLLLVGEEEKRAGGVIALRVLALRRRRT